MTRAEHLQWCKDRALKLCDARPVDAVLSMISDMNKHPDTAMEPDGALAMLSVLAMQQAARGETDNVRRYIEGFN